MNKILTFSILLLAHSSLFGQRDTAKLSKMATTLNSEGIELFQKGEKAKANAKYTEALEIYGQLATKDIDRYGGKFDKAYQKLRTYYSNNYLMDESIGLERKMVELGEAIAKKYPNNPKLVREWAIHNQFLGFHCNAQGRFDEAEKAFLQAIKTMGSIAHLSLERKVEWLDQKSNLGITYGYMEKLDKCIGVYSEIAKDFKVLRKQDTISFESEIARLDNNMGLAYYKMENFDSATIAFTEGLAIRRKLEKADKFTESETAEDNLREIAAMSGNLGNVFDDTHQFDESEKYYNQSLDIKRRFAMLYPDTYKQRILITCVDLAIHYLNRMKVEKTLLYKDKAIAALDEGEKNRAFYPLTVGFSKSYKTKIETLRKNIDAYKP
jgi:nephrocystin-3